jgi:hypothetical protein
MSKLTIPFYNLLPNLNEAVSVIFTEYTETHIKGYLAEYKNEVLLNYEDATKKRKVLSWRKIVPLNKQMFAKVEDNENVIRVSLVYLYDNKINEKVLTENLNKNNLLVSIFKNLSYNSKIDINELWKDIMYIIDINRREEYDDLPTLFDYCNEERDSIKDIFINSNHADLYELFLDLLDKYSTEKPNKIISEIEIISNGGIFNTINIIKNLILDIKFKHTLKYMSTPIFTFESSSVDSSEKDHNKFIKKLTLAGQALNPQTFVRCQNTKSIPL